MLIPNGKAPIAPATKYSTHSIGGERLEKNPLMDNSTMRPFQYQHSMLIHGAQLQNQMIKLKAKNGHSCAQFDYGSINKPNKKFNCKVSFRLSENKSCKANEAYASDDRQCVAPKGSFTLGAHTKYNAVRSPQCSETPRMLIWSSLRTGLTDTPRAASRRLCRHSHGIYAPSYFQRSRLDQPE